MLTQIFFIKLNLNYKNILIIINSIIMEYANNGDLF